MCKDIKSFIKEIPKRLWNKTSLVSIAALIVLLMQQCGLEIDSVWAANIVNTVCTLLVTIGILSETAIESKS